MIPKLMKKLRFYWNFALVDVPRIYRQKYTLLYPHGVLPRVAKKHPELAKVQVFVESGTFKGKTAMVESRYFREVHTIELSPDLYRANLPVFQEGFPNISAYEGDSASVLKDVVKNVREPCLFFLDAHWSGDHRVNWQDSEWKGYGTDTAFRGDNWPPSAEQQCPLVDEAQVIGESFPFPALVIIDDWSAAGTKDQAFVGEDWGSISLDRILEALGRNRVLECFQTEYAGKARMNIVLGGSK